MSPSPRREEVAQIALLMPIQCVHHFPEIQLSTHPIPENFVSVPLTTIHSASFRVRGSARPDDLRSVLLHCDLPIPRRSGCCWSERIQWVAALLLHLVPSWSNRKRFRIHDILLFPMALYIRPSEPTEHTVGTLVMGFP